MAVSFPASSCLSTEAANRLNVGDNVDHRDHEHFFALATVIAKQGTNLKIHYNQWSSKWDIWSDYKNELRRFAVAGSISNRPAHKFKTLKIGDNVDINPTQTHPEWKTGTVTRLSAICAQIQVRYEFMDKNYTYWVHPDNPEEIAKFKSKSGRTEQQLINDNDVSFVYVPPQKKRKIDDNKELGLRLTDNINFNTKDSNESLLENKEYIPGLDELNHQIQSLQKAKEKLVQEQVTDLTAERAELIQSIDELKRENGKYCHLKQEYDLLKTKINDYVKENNKLKAEIEKQNMHEKGLNDKCNELQRQLRNEQISRHEVEVKMNDTRNMLKDYKNANDKLMKQNESIERIINGKYKELQKKNQFNMEQLKIMSQKYEESRKQNEANMEKMNVLNEKYKESEKQNKYNMEQLNGINEKYRKLKKKNKLYVGDGEEIYTLNLSELKALESKLQNGMRSILDARERYNEGKLKCVACLANDKDIVFLGGCAHVALCSVCESKLHPKLCPICQAPYDYAKKIKL